MQNYFLKFSLAILIAYFSEICSVRAERLFDILIDDGSSSTRGYALVDTITAKDRIIQINRKGVVTWEAKIPATPKPGQICRGADIEYLKERNVFRILTPYNSISEINRDGEIKALITDNGVSHDFDSLIDGGIIYTRGWANKGENEVIEKNSEGKITFSWNGSRVISDKQWAQHAKIDYWPDKWNRRLKITQKGKDWLHVNSVEKLDDGHYLLSTPNLNSILKVASSGEILQWFENTFIVHDPVLMGKNIVFSEKVPNIQRSDFIERITVLEPSGEKRYLLNGKLRAIRGISLLEDGWIVIVSSGQILEINLDGEIRFRAKILAQNEGDEKNTSPYQRQKTLCGSGMGTLYKVAPIM